MNAAVGMVWGRRGRKGLLLAGGVIVFFALYTWFLNYQESRVKDYLEMLRRTNADQYLSQIRTVVTFDQYLDEYRRLKGYDEFRDEVPPFLLGRWALFTAEKRVSDFYFAEECTNSIAFEDDRVRTVGEYPLTYSAEYRLDGESVILRLDGAGEIPVRLVSYGVRLHHIELTPPGFDGPRYAYLCK